MSENIIDFPISATESFADLEQKMAELVKDKPYKIRFTSNLNTKGALGVEAAVLQLLGTWLRKNKNSKIFHSYQEPNQENFEKLCSSIYGIAALALVDEVWDKEKNKLSRNMVLMPAKYSIEALRKSDFSKSFKSKYIGIPFIKTPNYDKELDMLFYNNARVIQSDAFFRVFEKILRVKIAGYSRFESLKETINIEELSDLLWEIFKNTHDHGLIHENGDVISKNFRTILIQQQDLDEVYFEKWLGDSPSSNQKAFVEYWKSKKLSKYPFLDLSVVDFGEGFVELARKKVNISDDKEVFLKCWEAGWSRLSERSRGDGLTKVLNAVHNHNGWLRIRSGKYLIEKTFVEGNSSEITLEDIQEMPVDVVGTSFHVSFYLKGFEQGGKA